MTTYQKASLPDVAGRLSGRECDKGTVPLSHLEQGDAKATFIGSQGDGVDLMLKDVVLGVHGGVTGPGLESHKRSVVGGRPHADVLKALKVDLDAVARLAAAQRERGARGIGEHDGVVIEAAVRDGQHVRVVGSLVATLERHKAIGRDDGGLVSPSLGKRQLVVLERLVLGTGGGHVECGVAAHRGRQGRGATTAGPRRRCW